MLKPTVMQKRNLFRTTLVVLLFTGCFIVLLASSNKANSKTVCAESMDEYCKKDNKKTSSGEMIWETLSHQFFTAVDISN